MPASVDLEQLYRAHAHVVLRRARTILGNEADAREVLQDVFASLVGRPEQLEDVARPLGFLYRATTHRCLNVLRNSRTRLRLLSTRSVGPEPTPDNPEIKIVARDILAGLDDDSAKAAIYYYVDEMSQAEVARMLGCSRRHIGNLLQRLKAAQAEREGATC